MKQKLKASSRAKKRVHSTRRTAQFPLRAVRDLHFSLIRDVAESVDYDAERDIETLTKRYRHESFALLSKTLPLMDKALLTALRDGLYQQTYFKRATKHGVRLALPAFTLGLLSRIFDPGTGIIHAEPDYTAIAALHQIYTFTYKYEVKLPDAVVTKCIEQMITTDRELLPFDSMDYVYRREYPLTESDLVLTKAHWLLGHVLDVDKLRELTPKHGPGASNEPLLPHEKYNFTRYSSKLDRSYDFASYTSASLSDLYNRIPSAHKLIVSSGILQGTATSMDSSTEAFVDQRSKITKGSLPEFLSMCSKVCAVPKNSTTARIISAEPVGNMWIQGGQNRALVTNLETHPWTKGHTNFTDQTINQKLAIAGSLSGSLTTIDLSEASDRVARALVRALLDESVFKLLDASRCEYSEIVWPNGNKSYIRLNKFAPMGSGTCFPVEAMIFWALCVASILVYYNESLTVALESVYVYGDDIVVPTHFSEAIMNSLPDFGFKVNKNKSYSSGLFRESCGVDAYAGVDVTPVKLKTLAPQRITDAESIVGWVDFANECSKRGYNRVVSNIKRHIHKLTGPLPLSRDKLPILSWTGPCSLDKTKERKPKDPDAPFYQGYSVHGWFLARRDYTPSAQEFSESSRLLRRLVIPSANRDRLDRRLPSEMLIEDSTRFTTRYAVRLKRKRVFLS